MLKVISTLVAILVIAFFPPAALAFVSQNAIPGDKTYPVKRKLEDGILLVVSIRPSWKAQFTSVQSDRRLAESEALISQGKDASATLGDLVTTTNVAASEVSSVDPAEKAQLQQNLVTNINNYEAKLAQAETEAAKVTADTQLSAPTPAQQAQAVTNGVILPTPQPVSTQVAQIQQTKQQLDNIKLKIQNGDDNSVSPSPSPSTTLSSSHTPQPSYTPKSSNSHSGHGDETPKPSISSQY